MKNIYDVDIWSGPGAVPRQILLQKVKGADAIISVLADRIDATVLDAAGPQLKVVANYAVGYDNIDLSAATLHHVVVTNTPSRLGDSVAEMTITLMLALARRVVEADRFMRQGNYHAWDPNLFLGQDLSEMALGIVGMGTIGFETAVRAEAVLSMKIRYTAHAEKMDAAARGWKFTTLRDLLSSSDVVSLHVPLSAETRHLIGREELAMMKPSALLINTARGPIIDEAALVQALTEKTIWGAALDVFEHEVGLASDPVWQQLAALPNVIMTPHIGSATVAAREEMATIVADNVRAVLSGKPAINRVKT